MLFINAHADRWVTINGVHVLIGGNDGHTVIKGPANLLGKSYEYATGGKPFSTEHYYPENSYTKKDDYKEASENLSEHYKKKDEASKEWREQSEKAEKQSVPKPKEEWDFDDEVNSLLGDKPRKYTKGGKEAKEKADKALNRMVAEEKLISEFKDVVDFIESQNARIQRNNFSPKELVSTDKKDFEGFNIKTTGTSFGDEQLAKFPNNIVSMTPKEYLERSAYEIFNSTIEKATRGVVQDSSIGKYADMMKEGTKFDLPYLNYKDKGQEGRHRAIAADMLGIAEIPVLIIGREVRKK